MKHTTIIYSAAELVRFTRLGDIDLYP